MLISNGKIMSLASSYPKKSNGTLWRTPVVHVALLVSQRNVHQRLSFRRIGGFLQNQLKQMGNVTTVVKYHLPAKY
jgi:hypothetical protein